jgi:hypothetical protein
MFHIKSAQINWTSNQLFMNYFAIFYLDNFYYLPHFAPIINELKKRALPYIVLLPENKKRDLVDQLEMKKAYCIEHNYTHATYQDETLDCDFVFFANAHEPTHLRYKKSVGLFHACWSGKTVYVDKVYNNFDYRIVNSEFEKIQILCHDPDALDKLVVLGYSKLDFLKENTIHRETFLQKIGLDPNKKTVLYAPTFYPSSIMKIPESFPKELNEYNVIVKPHSFTYMRDKYTKDVERMQAWNVHENVFLADVSEVSIIPFMQVSDVLISDVSAVIYEFAALDKPVIVNRFLHTRWYYKFVKRKLMERIDHHNFHLFQVGDNAFSYQDMLHFINENITDPAKHQTKRQAMVNYVVGDCQNNISEKIVDWMLSVKENIG